MSTRPVASLRIKRAALLLCLITIASFISFDRAFAETLLQPPATTEAAYDPHNYTLKIPVIHLDEIYTTEDTLAYQDYLVKRRYEAKQERVFATIEKGDHVLLKLEQDTFGPDSMAYAIRFGLFSFLGDERKQLIIAQYSGGAHCCYYFRVYELEPDFHLIFDSRKFPVEDYMTEAVFLDVDKDSVFEISATINSFAYFKSVFSDSVMPEAVFKYDEKAKRYIPANHLFPAYSLDSVDEEIKKVLEMNRGDEIPDHDYFYYMLDVTLRYIYAGREKQAWDFFDKAYRKQVWGSKEKLRADIKEILRKDGFYRALYTD